MSRLGPLIEKSLVADIYAWGDHHIVKLYRPGASSGAAAREAAQARIARRAGIPTPGIVDVITVDGLAGIIFERVDGPTMLELLGQRAEEADPLARVLAGLHADLHGRPGDDLPSQRERLRQRISRALGVTAEARVAVLARLEALPEGRAFCHGDLHPGNIIMARSGPVIADWYDAACGSPAGDVARTLQLLTFAPLPPRLPAELSHGIDSARDAFRAAYLHHYAELRPETAAEHEAWRLPVAVGRLAELVSASEQSALSAFVGELLSHP